MAIVRFNAFLEEGHVHCNMWHVEGRRFGGGPARARCPALALGSRCHVPCSVPGRVPGRRPGIFLFFGVRCICSSSCVLDSRVEVKMEIEREQLS